MTKTLFVCVCSLLIIGIEGYKVLVFNPKIHSSHTNFLGRLADELVNAGHEVAVYQPILDDNLPMTGSKSPKIKYFIMPKNRSLYEGLVFKHNQDLYWKNEIFKVFAKFGKHKLRFCEEMLNDEVNLEAMRAENFDVAVTEHIEVCGYGVFKRLNITKYVTSISFSLFPSFTAMLGVKQHFSYTNAFLVPLSDTLNFPERVLRFVAALPEYLFLSTTFADKEEVALKKLYPDFNSVQEFARAAYLFVNADEHVDYVQPITSKVVYIANLGNGAPKPLSPDFENIVSKAKKGVILFSLGSVVQANGMPPHLRSAFLEAFAEFPDVTFLWKYETPEDGTADHLPNVITRKWIPQRDVLHHPKMLAFITHGGQNSFNEGIGAGVPLICLPVFGDQQINAQHIEAKDFGLQLDHKGLTKEKVVETLREIIENDKYRSKTQLVSNIIKKRNQWQTPESRFVKNVEMAAEFGDSGTLSAVGADQNLFVLYSLDVIGFLLAVLAFVIFVLVKISKAVTLFVKSRLNKPKSE